MSMGCYALTFEFTCLADVAKLDPYANLYV